jgi:branched-chain amino acid transport system substrate-binding protein
MSLAGASLVTAPFIRPSWAQGSPLKVGVMLPFSGTYAQLGRAITQGMELYVKQKGGNLAGRAVTFVKLDDEAEPSKATDNTNKIVYGEKVDVLTGTVHSGVALAMAKIAREAGLPTLVTNAGANDLTGSLCSQNIFRSSFSNGQVGIATGKAMAAAGIKDAVTFTWRYAAGLEMVEGFKESFTAGGGKIIKEITVPFPDVEFQSALAEIASLKPTAVYSFFAGGGATKFIKDFAGAKLNDSIQLWGPGFLTDGVEQAVGPAGDGIKTALHYVETLDNPENKTFRAAYKEAFNIDPDVYAVQGYDAMAILEIGLKAAGGDVGKKDAMFDAMARASFNSPRGPFKFSPSHNPVQNFYLRELRGGVNKYLGVAAEAQAENPKSCRMAS